MNADSPNASSFVRATLIPTAAAARSLERTAMNIRPGGRVAQPRDQQPDQAARSTSTNDAEDHARVGVALGDPEVQPEERRRRDVAGRAGRR